MNAEYMGCEIGVVDPVTSVQQIRLAQSQGDVLPDASVPRDLEELNRQIDEAKEDQRLRTVHIAGLPEGTDNDMLSRFCKNFGKVERMKVDKTTEGKPFGLVEFKDRGPAHILKTQKQYAVDGRVFTCTEAKVMVDESQFMEQTIQFQDSVRDAMGMRQILACQPELKDKLDKVRAAAMELVGGKEDSATAADEAGTRKADGEDKKKKKKEKAEKADGKKKKKKKKKKRGGTPTKKKKKKKKKKS